MDKELSDGVLASFTTATDAVSCARVILKGCGRIEDLELRIGIHLGEVVFENNYVFGDGVNIASRLQALASIGGIWISESVYKNIANKKEFRTRFVREEVLKHVKEPVRVYEVLTDDAKDKKERTGIKDTIKSTPQKSIAVLPFVNMSNPAPLAQGMQP